MMRIHAMTIALGGALLTAGAGLGRADEPPASAPPKINLADLQSYYERILPELEQGRRPEAADQLIMLLFSTPSKPLPGWYGPGRSRYDWIWLAARFDANRDGQVRREEFRGPDAAWGRLDRDGNGALTREDLDWSETSEWLRRNAQAQQRFRAFDTDSDGQVTAEEWAAFFTRAAGSKGALSPSEFRDLMTPASAQNGPQPMSLKERADRLADQLAGNRSFNEGPQVGELAPDFSLKTADGKGPITLSSFRGSRPVALTFGSITCPPYRELSVGLDPLRKRFGDQVEFLGVYVREAHPSDGWATSGNSRLGIDVRQPTSLAERIDVAQRFCAIVKPSYPVLVDNFDDRVGHAYSGMPNRLYLIDRAGKIVYKSGRGPNGYKTGELEQVIELLLLDQNSAPGE